MHGKLSGVQIRLRPTHAALCVLAVPLIPLAVSSLAGISHLRSCTAARGTPFSVSYNGGATAPLVSSALVLERDAAPPKACAGLELLAQAQPQADGTVRIVLPIRNTSTLSWHATVRVSNGKTSFPVRVGRVGVAQTASASVDVKVPTGESQITATLLVGP